MLVYLIEGEILQDIADAVREKKGSTDRILTENMASEIRGISGGPTGDGEDKFHQFIQGTLTEVTAEDFSGTTVLRSYTFYNHPALERVEFAEDLWDVGSNTFKGCQKLETVDFSKCTRVRYLNSYSFQDCISLREIVVKSTVERIDPGTFQGCTSLSSVTFEEGAMCNSVNMYAFCDCTSLAEITIPQDVTSMGFHAFRNCTSLKLVRLKPKTPPSIQSNTFTGVPTDCVYMVDYGCGDAYKSATNWSAYADQIVEEEGGGGTEGGTESWLFEEYGAEGVYINESSSDLPAPTPGVSYTCFVDGEEIGTAIAVASNTELGETRMIQFITEDFRVFLMYEDGMWWFHPVDSQVQSGKVAIRING
jgi:hypothetical protein